MAMTKSDLLHIVRFIDLEKWSAHDAVFENMDNRFPLVPLSKVLKRVKEPVVIEDETIYKRITVRLYGQGVLQRDELLGKEIGTKRQFIAHVGQLIISRIDARNGAFGIVPPELEGAIVTNDFWLFEVHDACPEYIMLVLSSDLFQKYWQTQSSGTTNRQRIDEKSFIASKIALPTQSVQEKITSRYNDTISKAKALELVSQQRKKNLFLLWDNLLGIKESNSNSNGLFNIVHFRDMIDWSCRNSIITFSSTSFKIVPLKSLCNVNSGGTPSRATPEFFTGSIPWVKTAEVLDEEITDTEEKITEEALEKSSARLYPSGCIIVAMYGQTRGQTAKLAIEAATNQACAVLHHIDNDIVLTDYLWFYLQGQYQRIRKLAVGSAQPNLNAQMIKDYPVILPPISSDKKDSITQKSIVTTIKKEKESIGKIDQTIKRLFRKARTDFDEAIYGSKAI